VLFVARDFPDFGEQAARDVIAFHRLDDAHAGAFGNAARDAMFSAAFTESRISQLIIPV